MKTYTVTQEQLDETQDRRWRWPGVTGPGEYTWNEGENRYEPVVHRQIATDFDRGGFGIGGLGRYEEPPFIPTKAQMDKLECMEARATYCRRCGESDVFDGAMFTTLASSGLCDDCV